MKRILIIEDEPDMRRNLLLLLKLEGFDSVGAEDGKRGLELARTTLPDLILCDVMMPVLDGHGVLSALRADTATANIPFVFLTARGELADLRTGMNLGADDYLIKPVGVDDLLAAITTRLKRHESHGQAGKALATARADFSSAQPLESLGITARQAEILLWVAQGKTNPEIALILGLSQLTVKKHLENIFERMGVETRHSAALRAIEVLSGQAPTE